MPALVCESTAVGCLEENNAEFFEANPGSSNVSCLWEEIFAGMAEGWLVCETSVRFGPLKPMSTELAAPGLAAGVTEEATGDVSMEVVPIGSLEIGDAFAPGST